MSLLDGSSAITGNSVVAYNTGSSGYRSRIGGAYGAPVGLNLTWVMAARSLTFPTAATDQRTAIWVIFSGLNGNAVISGFHSTWNTAAPTFTWASLAVVA